MLKGDINYILSLLKEGEEKEERKIRFLPLPKEAGEIVTIRLFPPNPVTAYKYDLHWGFQRPIPCKGEECLICNIVKNYVNALYSKGKELDFALRKELAKKIYQFKAQPYIALYVVKKGDNGFEPMPYIWQTGQMLLKEIRDYEELGESLIDPKTGKNIVLKRSESGRIERKYIGSSDITDVLAQIEEEFGDNLPPVSEFIKYPDDEKYYNAIREIEERVAYHFDKKGLNLFDFVEPLPSIDEYNEANKGKDKKEGKEEKESPQQSIGEELSKAQSFGVGEFKFADFNQYKQFVSKLIGIEIPDNFKCFGEYSVESDKCLNCEYSIQCEDFKQLLEIDDDYKYMAREVYKSIKGGE